MSDLPARLARVWDRLSTAQKREAEALIRGADPWSPLCGPQTEAWGSNADIVGYGGAAGGGKTDLICGLAMVRHRRTIIYRKEAVQLDGIVDRLEQINGTRTGYNGQSHIWRLPGRIIKLAGVSDPNSHKKYQGQPHDLKCFDEATEFPESQVRFLMGWLRSDDPNVRQQVLLTFNPPTTSEGRWVIKFFSPWLDKSHPNPARTGELRYYTTDPETGEDMECDGPEPIEIDGDMVTPMSRTFIPARVEDNPYYMETGYKRVLQAMPEPLRSQMLLGDFSAGVHDDPWQVYPTVWVDAAMDRWAARDVKGEMDSMGVDVAYGGLDETVIARRHGNWFDKLLAYPGAETASGSATAGKVVVARRDQAPVHIDMIGWGASAHDSLKDNGVQTIGIKGSNSALGVSVEGNLRFANMRSEVHWRLREWLDPNADNGAALPPNPKLREEMCAILWKFGTQGIQVESKEQGPNESGKSLKQRLGRSPNYLDAVVNGLISTVKKAAMQRFHEAQNQKYNPHARLKR